MKYVAALTVAAMIGCCTPALADDIDLSVMTCKNSRPPTMKRSS